MAKISTGRVIQGGLLAGVVLNVVCIVNQTMIIGERLGGEQQVGHFLMEPRFPFLPIWILLMFLIGIALVWLYAAVRPRLGPGVKTALTVGIVAGLLSGVPDNLAHAAWGLSGYYLPFSWMVERVVGFALATLVGAWWYKEPEGGF